MRSRKRLKTAAHERVRCCSTCSHYEAENEGVVNAVRRQTFKTAFCFGLDIFFALV